MSAIAMAKADRRHGKTGAMLLIGVFCAALASGCQYDPFAHTYLVEEANVTNVVGRYRLVLQTANTNGLQAVGGASYIELRADGTFSGSNLPPSDFHVQTTNLFNSLLSGEGKWEVVKVGIVGNDSSGYKDMWGLELKAPGVDFDSPKLMGKKPPYGLIFTISDPDCGYAMIYGKEMADGAVLDPLPHADVDNFLEALLWLLGLLAGVAVAGALLILTLILGALLVGLGIVSTSVLAGVLCRKASVGFKTFGALVCALAGLGLTLPLVVVGSKLIGSTASIGWIASVGSAAGLLGGMAVWFGLVFVVRAVTRKLRVSASKPVTL